MGSATSMPKPVAGYMERRNKFRVGVHRAECPDVAELRIVARTDMPVFLAEISPNLVYLPVLAIEVSHLRVHYGRASLPDLQHQGA